ncbi:DUF1643 domain-containing protein [Methylobacterium radiodurans]|uniref:DUF1643 domain-containing protein n=1 Tax=Methylobacterium radiodurans TaxID=2202828 RepID=A0A2U8VQ31_9HYPH|nr:DUF1643 domain-containing protein [Methylobacterium radiodurans]AWN35743.1 hypothetical protein DK427_08295 [Methylobacterium radiodurans]
MIAILAATDLFGTPFADTIQRGADLSRCGLYRWTLTRTWSSEGGHVCFIGLNPSTADHRKDDPTVCRWMHFARSWGYGGFTAVNLYPFRSSTPDPCRAWSRWQENGPDYHARDRLWENEDVVVREATTAALVVACWGAGAWDPMWADHVLEEIQNGEAPWPDIHCFGLSKDGHPMHPMARGRSRIPDHARPVLWKAGSPQEGGRP